MSIEFKCPQCAQTLEVAESYAGQAASCPSCSTKVTIPAPGAATVRPNRVFCQKCGIGNDARAAACAGCGHPIRPVAAGDGGALSTMIPYKNVSALLG
jgi:DNA-directed RNA polymerase subunit RPC12/RpoP